MTTVRDALAQAHAAGIARLDAQLLVAHRLGVERVWLLAHDDAPLSAAQAAGCAADFARRADGVPVAQIVGSREFHGLRLTVTPDVLDPRPDTETLVDWALELLAGTLADASHVVDLGTGTGAIALAVKHACPRLRMVATDASAPALAVARGNAAALGLDVEFLHGDWWHALPGCRFELALSNPPYIPAGDPHLAALRHEPPAALTPGPDGLAAIRRLLVGAADHLAPGGWLLLEHGCDQGEQVREHFRVNGFVDVSTRHDLSGQARCTGGRRAGGPRA